MVWCQEITCDRATLPYRSQAQLFALGISQLKSSNNCKNLPNFVYGNLDVHCGNLAGSRLLMVATLRFCRDKGEGEPLRSWERGRNHGGKSFIYKKRGGGGERQKVGRAQPRVPDPTAATFTACTVYTLVQHPQPPSIMKMKTILTSAEALFRLLIICRHLDLVSKSLGECLLHHLFTCSQHFDWVPLT